MKRHRILNVLAAVYSVTDCSNEVHDYAILHHAQAKIAREVPDLIIEETGVAKADGDGFIETPERYGSGFRLTKAGYEALTAFSETLYPANLRRFEAHNRKQRAKGRKGK